MSNRPSCLKSQVDLVQTGRSLTIELMDSPAAAKFLGISEANLRNKVSCGQIPYYKFGRRNRYVKAELENLILNNKRGSHGN
jgi:hypothetical protein